jgi:hypothetical protein
MQMPSGDANACSRAATFVGLKVDPSKPVWVSYSLFALSAETDRKGEVVVEGSPEGVAVPIADARVRFSAERMSVLRGSEKVASRLMLRDQVKSAAGEARDYISDLEDALNR